MNAVPTRQQRSRPARYTGCRSVTLLQRLGYRPCEHDQDRQPDRPAGLLQPDGSGRPLQGGLVTDRAHSDGRLPDDGRRYLAAVNVKKGAAPVLGTASANSQAQAEGKTLDDTVEDLPTVLGEPELAKRVTPEKK